MPFDDMYVSDAISKSLSDVAQAAENDIMDELYIGVKDLFST